MASGSEFEEREDMNADRRPLCPKCNQPMKMIQARDHWFWRCFTVGVWHRDLYGILGQASNFTTRKVVDPVTLRVMKNPNFRTRSVMSFRGD